VTDDLAADWMTWNFFDYYWKILVNNLHLDPYQSVQHFDILGIIVP
jgi:hypothetical protein